MSDDDQQPRPETPAVPEQPPAEAPPPTPDIDVPAPSSPGTDAPAGPVSPVG